MSDDAWVYNEEPFTSGLHIGPCPECEKLRARVAELEAVVDQMEAEIIILRREKSELEAANAKFRNALDWIECEPEDPAKVQMWARAALGEQ